jgi:hypothetical protein
MPFTRVSKAELAEAFPELNFDEGEWRYLLSGLNQFRRDFNVLGTDPQILFQCLDRIRNEDGYIDGYAGDADETESLVDKIDNFVDRRRRVGDAPPKKMEGGNFRHLKTRGMRGRGAYDMFKKFNRKMVKNVMVPGMDFVAGLIPAVMGQPELTPFAVAGAHALGTAAQKPLLGMLRSDKRQRNLDEQETSRKEQEEEDEIMSKYKISGKGIMNQPRSRSVGSDMLSPMAAATMGHSQSMNMKNKLEQNMAMGRQKQMGLIGVSGNLLGPGHIPALQSQPQQNFQFRHTITGAAYHPHVYGNGLYA